MTEIGGIAMKPLMLLTALAIGNLAPGWAVADDAGKTVVQGIAGNWEGDLKVTPQISLRITFKVVEAKDGSLSGTWDSPDEGLEAVPFGSIAFQDDVTDVYHEAWCDLQGKAECRGQRGRRRMDPAGQELPDDLQTF